MKRIVTSGLLLSMLVSCNDRTTGPSTSNVNGGTGAAKAEQAKLKVKVENRNLVKMLTIDGIELAYNPLTLTHNVTTDKVEIKSLAGELVAQVVVVDKDGNNIVDDTGSNTIVSINGVSKKLEIEILDLDRAMDLLRHNLHDSLAGNMKKINGSVLELNKDEKSKDLKNYVHAPFEAPVQNLVISQVFSNVKQIGTSDFWIDNKLQMVKAQKRNSLASAKFDVINSINIEDSIADNFKVKYAVTSLDKNYQKLEMTVTNDIDAGAFVTSNPVSALGHSCSGKIAHTNIRGERLSNGIKYSVAFKKGYLADCLNANQTVKKLYIYDQSLNKIEKQF